MMQVYRHHCIHQLSEEQRRLRDAAIYIEANADAVQWGLELEGYKDVRLVSFTSRTRMSSQLLFLPRDGLLTGLPLRHRKTTHGYCHLSLGDTTITPLVRSQSGSTKDQGRGSVTSWDCKCICSHQIAGINLIVRLRPFQRGLSLPPPWGPRPWLPSLPDGLCVQAFHARQAEVCDAPDTPPSSPTNGNQNTPVLCHISVDVHLSL